MRYVDIEHGINITENNVEPDWSKWASVNVEETYVEDENGTLRIDLIMYCRKYTEVELAERALEAKQRRIMEQTPIALQLCVLQANLPDELALQVEALYPEWEVGSTYVTGDIRLYNDILYKALQNSTAAAEHTPDVAVSLWKAIKAPDESGVFPWIQPLGATDAYKKGDRVSHNGKIYISQLDDNVWEPGTDTSLWVEEA